MVTISLCMIVHNEENNIRRCLESAQALADEIIVVDTGSTDRTKAVCEQYGARVYDYKWEDNFAKARNFSLSKASCDWILLMDADEEIVIRNQDGLRRYLSDTVYNQIFVRLMHFYGEPPADEKCVYFSGAPRLVRNDGTVRFTGKIHETIVADGKNTATAAENQKFIRILHYGYMNDCTESKTDRNLSMLLRETDRRSDDPWINYFLSAEYYRLGNIVEALREINSAIILFIGKKLKPPSLMYKLKYDMLIAAGHYDLAYGGIEKAIALYPDYVDLYFYKGYLQYWRGEYDHAEKTFMYCLILGETNINHLILSGSGSFLAMYYLGLCYEKKSESEYAAEAFRPANALYPDFDSTGHRFADPGKIILNQLNLFYDKQ